MARYIVLEFTDNAEAELFVQQTHELSAQWRKENIPFRRRVVGVFAKPGRTCECTDRSKANFGVKDWPAGIALGERFGWWVCTRCNRPREGGHQLHNLLEMNDTYEGTIFNDYEFCVTSIDVTGIHTSQVDRPKKLRLKRKKAKDA